MRADTYEAAQQAPDHVTELRVSAAWRTPWQEIVASLPALERLHLEAGVDPDPSAVPAWPASLRCLRLHVSELKQRLPPWVDALPGLETLELHIEAAGAVRLPDCVAWFPRLTRLEVRAARVELPDALAESAVTRLGLALEPGEVPEGLCRLRQLEQLRLAQRVRTLPAAFSQLTALHTLDLSRSLNDGATRVKDDPASRFQPMPSAIAELPSLRTLNLDMCAIFERDLELLAGHPRLRRLTLGYAGVADLSALRALPALRELDLRASLRLRDLSPLSGLPLTWLGLDGCTRLRDLSPLLELPELRGLALEGCDNAALGPVMTHPTLEHVTGDDDMLAQWSRRTALRGACPADIRAGLASDSPARRLQALSQLATWVELTSARGANAIYGLLGLGRDARDAEAPVPIPLLSEALSTPDVGGALAARVFAACFRSVRDNLAPALEAAELVCGRGSDADEVALVDAFLFARRFYDAGHRSWEDDVHEAMIERFLPRLGGAALTHLLTQLDDADLHGDELDALFKAAYGRAPEALLDALDARLRAYLEGSRGSLDAEHLSQLLSGIVEERAEARERLADVLPDTLEMSWQSRLMASLSDPAAARREIEALVAEVTSDKLPLDELAKLDPYLQEAIKASDDLPVAVARRLLELSRLADCETWLRRAVLRPLIRDDLDWLEGLEEPTQKTVLKWLAFWQRDEPTPEGVDLTAARARLAGVSEQEMAQKAVVASIDEGLKFHRKDLDGALARFASNPFSMEWTRARSRSLARRLDGLRTRRRADDAVRLMATLRSLRPHLSWAPADQQYALTYLLPIAVERGPGFFAEHVAPWLEGVDIVDPRFAYNLACYQAAHGDTAALCAAIERALALGKPKAQFLDDADFQARLQEPQVAALLGSARRRSRYYALRRVSYYNAPCRFVDMGYRPDRPAWWKHDWQGGEPLATRPAGPLRFELKPFRESHPEMGRALPLLHLSTVPLMHASLVRVLEDNGAKLEKIPAALVDPDDGTEHGDYFAVNVLGVLSPEALGRFHGRLTDTGHTTDVGFADVDHFEQPLDGLTLAWLADTFTLVAFESLCEALREAGFDELEFQELTQIAT